MMNLFDIMKVPVVNGSVIAATTFIESMGEVLSVLLLATTLFWTCVNEGGGAEGGA